MIYVETYVIIQAMDTLHSRLRHARITAGFPSARAAAARYGWSPSTYGAHENGQNSFDADTAIIYAKAFSCDLAWLALGETREKQKFDCEILGFAKNPDEIRIIENKSELKGESVATIVFQIPDRSKALCIYGDEFWPRYTKRDLIIMKKSNIEEKSIKRLVGEECFVWTKTDERHLRRVTDFNTQLELVLSAHNRPTSLKVSLTAIREIWYTAMIVPFPNWSTLNLQMEHAEASKRLMTHTALDEHK